MNRGEVGPAPIKDEGAKPACLSKNGSTPEVDSGKKNVSEPRLYSFVTGGVASRMGHARDDAIRGVRACVEDDDERNKTKKARKAHLTEREDSWRALWPAAFPSNPEIPRDAGLRVHESEAAPPAVPG